MAIITVKKAKNIILEKYRSEYIDKRATEALLRVYTGHKNKELINIKVDEICKEFDPIFVTKKDDKKCAQ